MFNLFPKFGSPGDCAPTDDLTSKPATNWFYTSTPTFTINGKTYKADEISQYIGEILAENQKLKNELESIEEDGTEEHNNAIKLREENVELKKLLIDLKEEVENWKKSVTAWRTQYDQEVAKNTKLEDEILEYKKGNKNWMNLYQEVVDKNNDLLNKGGLKYMEAKLQIVQNNYTKCSKERDEFKHQLNAAEKEIEAIKKEKKESFEILKKAIEDESARFHNLVAENTNNWINLKAANKEIEILKNWKKEQLTVQSWWDKVDSYVRDHDDAPLGGIVANTCLNFLKERDELKKRIDGLSLTIDRKNFEIDDLKAEVKKLKEDIVDYVIKKDDELKKAQDWNNLNDVKIEKQKHPMYPIHWGGWDKEKTTTENLEERFDKGENVLDYFNKIEITTSSTDKWLCPCNKCKDARAGKKEKSWEEAASDLALRVVKLEKKVRELTLIRAQVNLSNISTSSHDLNIKATN